MLRPPRHAVDRGETSCWGRSCCDAPHHDRLARRVDPARCDLDGLDVHAGMAVQVRARPAPGRGQIAKRVERDPARILGGIVGAKDSHDVIASRSRTGMVQVTSWVAMKIQNMLDRRRGGVDAVIAFPSVSMERKLHAVTVPSNGK